MNNSENVAERTKRTEGHLAALRELHALIAPKRYLELGCGNGSALALARCESVGIDSGYEISHELSSPTRLYRKSHSEFFESPDVLRQLGGRVDLSVMGWGMSSAEEAMRCFIELERNASDRGVIAVENVLAGEMAGVSASASEFLTALKLARPDLSVDVFETEACGLAVISNLSPWNEVAKNTYADAEDLARQRALAKLAVYPMGQLAQRLSASWAPRLTRSFDSLLRDDVLKHYHRGVMAYTYRDIQCVKSPIDMALYLKLIWDLQPRTVIEIGAYKGGSAVMFADILTGFAIPAHVYSIDLDPPKLDSPGVTFVRGDVHDLSSAFLRAGILDAPRPWLVTEDSAHSYSGCLAALRYLSRVMTAGDVLVMEDGNLVELGIEAAYSGGPSRAISEFFGERPTTFEIMSDLCDFFGPNATYNPNGYMRKL